MLNPANRFPYNTFKVYVTDSSSSSPLKFPGAHMVGNKIETPNMDGWTNFKLSAHEKEHLEDDPNFKCRIYHHSRDYDRCLENQITFKSNLIIGCSAPWMTSHKVQSK